MKKAGEQPSRASVGSDAISFGSAQALARWAEKWTHDMIERDPELHRRLNEATAFFFRRMAEHLEQEAPRRRRRARRSENPA